MEKRTIEELWEKVDELEDAILSLGHWETNWRGKTFIPDKPE